MEATDLSRLRFVVAHFRQLQGLRMAAFGTFILIVFFPWRRPGDLSVTGILLVPGLAGLIFALKRIAAWYELRFGRIEPGVSHDWSSVLAVLFTLVLPILVHPGPLTSVSAYMKALDLEWFLGFLFVVLGVGTRLKPRLPETRLARHAGSLARWYYLPFGLAFLFLSLWKSRGGHIQMNFGIDGLFTILMGVAFIVTGLADHFYLLRTFPVRSEIRNV